MAAQWWNLWSRVRASLGLGTSVRFGYLPLLRGPGADEAGGDPTSLPAVYGAASLLSDALTALEWQVVRRASDYRGVTVLANHPGNRALDRWSLSSRWAWVWSALVSGNGVCLVEGGEITTYPAERVEVRLYDNHELRFGLVPWLGGEVREVAAETCGHLRYRPTTRDERLGVSPLTSCSPALDLLLNERWTARAILRNSSRPGGYLSTEGKIDPQRAEALKERWERIFQGPSQAGSTAVLEQGLEYHTIDLRDLQQIAFVESSNLGTSEVARLFNVPPALLAGDPQSRASATEARRWLYGFAVSPLSRLVEDALAAVLLTPQERAAGLKVQCDDSVTQFGQGIEAAESVSKMVNAGIMSVNEARDWMSYAPVEDGSILRAPSNTFALPAWADWQPASASETNGSALDRAAPPSRRRITAQARLLQIRDDLLGPDAP